MGCISVTLSCQKRLFGLVLKLQDQERKPNQMILSKSGCESVENYITNPESATGAVNCPNCFERLWRHGSYKRRCEGETVCAVIWVRRLLCCRCRRTFALLDEFVLPRKLVSAAVQDHYVEKHLALGGSLRASAWSEDETAMNPSTSLSRMSRAVKEACEAAPQIWLLLQQLIAAMGYTFAQILDDESGEKRGKTGMRLGLLYAIRERLAKQFSSDAKRIRNAYRALILVYRFPTPQSLNHALF
jgi:hypothetical protein